MSFEKKRKIVEKKWNEFKNNVAKIHPDAFDLYVKAIDHSIELWKRIGMYIGEEETHGAATLRIEEDFKLHATAFETLHKTAIFKVILDKLEEELKWFKENREMLEVLIKEYWERESGR